MELVSPENCPTPVYHETHKYCPSCTWQYEEPKAKPGMYAIGSDVWPGLSKLIEECGEVLQVAGKIMGAGGSVIHWDDNGDLRERLENELADLQAAISFVVDNNDLDWAIINVRAEKKQDLFRSWHKSSKS